MDKVTIGDAIARTIEIYWQNRSTPHIRKPVANALYRAWLEYDRIENPRPDLELEMPTYSDMEIGREK